MADRQDYNDDGYQLSDPDSMDNPSFDETSGDYYDDPLQAHPLEGDESARLGSEQGPPGEEGKKNILRNAIIAVVIVVALMITYAYIWPLFTAKKTPVPVKKPPVVQPAPVKPVQPAKIEPVPEPKPQPVMGNLEEKLNTLESGQQNTRSEVNAVNSQLTGMSTNLQDLSAQVSKLNQVIAGLSTTLSEQAQAIAILNAQLQQAKKPAPAPVITKRPHKPALIYFIKALVPGRAWLIASNGSTLTVREGSMVPGYGRVRLIDAQQGRVLVGSGRVIRFSPDDS